MTTTPDQGDERRALLSLVQNKSVSAQRGHEEAAAAFVTYDGAAADLNELSRYVALLEKAICALSAAQPVAQEASEGAEDEWRRLALQFDGHRMQAMGLIRYAITRIAKNGVYEDLRAKLVEFNAAPPLSGEAILVERIAALAAPMPQPEPTSKGAKLLAAINAGTAFADGDAEAAWIAHSEHLNCPACGGSGHVDDVSSQQREPQEAAERPANFTELWELYSRVGDAHENHGRNHEKTMEARATFHAALMRALSAPQEASKVAPVADDDALFQLLCNFCQASQDTDRGDARWDKAVEAIRRHFASPLYLRPTQQALGEDAAGEFADWLCREMPPGTVISDPAWWAPKIMRAILAAAGGSEK